MLPQQNVSHAMSTTASHNSILDEDNFLMSFGLDWFLVLSQSLLPFHQQSLSSQSCVVAGMTTG